MENYIEFHESIAKRCAGFDQMPPFGTCEACRKEFVKFDIIKCLLKEKEFV